MSGWVMMCPVGQGKGLDFLWNSVGGLQAPSRPDFCPPSGIPISD